MTRWQRISIHLWSWRLAVREWFERIFYCHHNARVLVDMEGRFGVVLSEATRGRMSKAYYTTDAMLPVIQDAFTEEREEGYQEGKQEYREPLEAAYRAARMALFVMRRRGVEMNDSWRAGVERDLAKAREALGRG